MLRWIILTLAVVVLTAIASFLLLLSPDSTTGLRLPGTSPASTGPLPKLEVIPGQLTHNFGTMLKQSEGTHTWQVKNVGEGVLEVWVEGWQCSCTVAKLGGTTIKKNHEKETVLKIKPGESKPVEVGWETKDWNNFGQSVTIGTNDPNLQTFLLTITGKVVPAVMVLPSQVIAFSRISNEEANHASVVVATPDQVELKLPKMTSSKPAFIVAKATPMTAEELRGLEARSGYHVVVEVKPGMPLGRFNEQLIIETNHPKQTEVKMTITGDVTGPIMVIPEGVRLPDVSSRQGASRDLTLLVRGGLATDFKVARKPAQVEVDIVREDTATLKGRYRLTVRVPPGTPAGPINGQIILKTDHPKVSELKIPVYIFVSRTGPTPGSALGVPAR
jgi:hypothetical protein